AASPPAHCSGAGRQRAVKAHIACARLPLQCRPFHVSPSQDSTMSQPSWFTEAHPSSGSSIGFRVEKLLHAEKTPFQTIEIYQTTDWGNLMVIDGCVMLTSRDNFLYHEM